MRVLGVAGLEGAVAELALERAAQPYRLLRASAWEPDSAQDELRRHNPLLQVPTLLLPDGTVMSESAAITLLLADITGDDSLVPGPKAKERTRFLRWLVFLVANVYPTFTYGDIPGRFVPVEEAQAPFLAAVEAYRAKLWKQVEGDAKGPWFLGERFSAIDIFIAVMTIWQPKRPWFEVETPKLFAISRRCEEQARLAEFWNRNCPES